MTEQEFNLKIKNTLWEYLDEDDVSYGIHDSIVELLGIEPTINQIKIVFFMFNMDIIGESIKWGLSDTVVRDSIYEFIRDNIINIIKELKL